MAKQCGFLSEFSDTGKKKKKKVKISTTYGKSPTRSAGRCGWLGGA